MPFKAQQISKFVSLDKHPGTPLSQNRSNQKSGGKGNFDEATENLSDAIIQ